MLTLSQNRHYKSVPNKPQNNKNFYPQRSFLHQKL